MKFILFLISLFILNLTFASKLTPEQRAELITKKGNAVTEEDFEHENLGCPENSECTEEMGKQRKEWLNLLSQIKKEKLDQTPEKMVQKLNVFVKDHGLLIDFLTTKTSFNQFSPILFESPCSLHNPKNNSHKIYIGTAFIKNISANETTLQLGTNKHLLPQSSQFMLDPVYVFSEKEKKFQQKFYLSHHEKPLYLDQGNLVTIREEEGLFYGVKYSTKNIEIVRIKSKEELKIQDYVQDSECPKYPEADEFIKKDFHGQYFQDSYCQRIYDIQKKSFHIIKLYWSCQ